MGPAELIAIFGLIAVVVIGTSNFLYLTPLYLGLIIAAISTPLALVLGVIAALYWRHVVVSAKPQKSARTD